MIKIEKNIPAPQNHKRGGPGRKYLYPFHEMEVGDSFIAEKDSVCSSAIAFAKRNGGKVKFTTMRLPNGTFRVWRIV